MPEVITTNHEFKEINQKDEVDNLLKQGEPTTLGIDFVRDLQTNKFSPEERSRFSIIKAKIILQTNSGIFGYLSSSSTYDRRRELETASFITECFKDKEGEAVKPTIVMIDNFYKFIAEDPSIVMKTRYFREIAEQQNPNQDHAIILTGFTDSKIFAPSIIDKVPTQKNAGLELRQETEFGKKLFEFARKKLPKIIKEKNGNLEEVLNYLRNEGKFIEEDAQLLLVTCLLLVDAQNWQNLTSEHEREIHTALYIVAPQPFHNAINRLNESWGHGMTEYSYRASLSLGANGTSPLEDEQKDNIKPGHMLKQGLSAEEFQRRIENILDKWSSQ